jgi:hypothetical protein
VKSPLVKDGETVPYLPRPRDPVGLELPSPGCLPMLDAWGAVVMEC